MESDYLILRRASAFRPSGERNDDDYDVLCNGVVVGRIMQAAAHAVMPHGRAPPRTAGYSTAIGVARFEFFFFRFVSRGTSPLTYRDRGRMGGMAMAIGWPPPRGLDWPPSLLVINTGSKICRT